MRRLLPSPAALAVLAVTGCASAGAEEARAPADTRVAPPEATARATAPRASGVAPDGSVSARAGSATAPALPARLDRGKEMYEAVCTTCHTLTPPPSQAPPMLMVVGHYLAFHGSPDAARTALVEWVRNPAAERSALPPHAIERFGLMPPQGLRTEDLEAVADYLLHLYDDEGMSRGRGRGGGGQGPAMRGGDGHRHRHGGGHGGGHGRAGGPGGDSAGD